MTVQHYRVADSSFTQEQLEELHTSRWPRWQWWIRAGLGKQLPNALPSKAMNVNVDMPTLHTEKLWLLPSRFTATKASFSLQQTLGNETTVKNQGCKDFSLKVFWWWLFLRCKFNLYYRVFMIGTVSFLLFFQDLENPTSSKSCLSYKLPSYAQN